MPMKPLRTIIVDDEEKARINLKSLLEEYCPAVQVVATEERILEAIRVIEANEIDLVFLDIEMQGESGFDLLERINDFDFDVIFVTAHDEYAIKAFKFSAIDYILKPINIDELIESVEKARNKKEHLLDKERYDMMIDNLKNRKGFEKIALPTMDGLLFVDIKDIIRCESDDNYTNFFLTTGKHIMVSKTIKHFEDILTDHNFFRIHRSHIVNLNHIKKYIKGEGGYVIMSDETSVLVSRRKKEMFLRLLNPNL